STCCGGSTEVPLSGIIIIIKKHDYCNLETPPLTRSSCSWDLGSITVGGLRSCVPYNMAKKRKESKEILSDWGRRPFWNPDIVLVHYLNVPAIEDCGKPCGPILCSINTDKKEWAKWTKEELIGQLKPMSGSSVHHKCNSAKHRIISPKVEPRAGGYGGHAEVQHNDVSEGKQEHSHHGKGSSREKRNGKVAKPVLLHQNSTEVSSTNQVEVPDTTQSSPVSISSGLNSDPDMVDSPVVTGVSSMAVASVMGSLSQSATVFMSEVTNEAVYTMSPTAGPNHHLLSPDASQGLVLAVSSDGHKFAFPTTGSSESLSMLPTNVSEELVLSTTLDGGRKIPETTMNFDPDCFLNNPKQGQTYGGGGLKAEMVSTNVRHSPPVERGFGFTTVLTKEIKTEDTSFEQQMAKEAYSSSAAAAASSSLTLTAGSSLLPSGGGLSPSTTLEQMDFSAIDSNKDYTSSFSQTGHSPHVHQTPSPSFFLQDASKPLPIEQNAHSSLSDSGGTFVMPTVKTEASSQTSSCSGHVETRIESTSSLHLMQFQANFQAMATEGEVTMETSQVAEGGEGLMKSGELQACSSEHYLQPEPTGVIRSAGGVPLLPGNVVQGLYPVAQPGLGNASNMELSLDHFDISFSNQFSDLINDFISVEGGGGTIYGHQLVSGDGTALSQSEDGARAPFTQAEMCIPCCSPQQGGLQLSSAEGGAGTMAYMHVAEVVSAASASGTLGMLQQSGRVFMVTDYSPEWSYPEGGVKVLITGPWQEASNNYSCLFDQISVPASLIQPGVLRCYCPDVCLAPTMPPTWGSRADMEHSCLSISPQSPSEQNAWLQGWAHQLSFHLNTATSSPQTPREPGLLPLAASPAGPAPTSGGLAGSHSQSHQTSQISQLPCGGLSPGVDLLSPLFCISKNHRPDGRGAERRAGSGSFRLTGSIHENQTGLADKKASEACEHKQSHTGVLGVSLFSSVPQSLRDVASSPGRGTKIPRAVGQLSLLAATTEADRRKQRNHRKQQRGNPSQLKEEGSPGEHTPTCVLWRLPSLRKTKSPNSNTIPGCVLPGNLSWGGPNHWFQTSRAESTEPCCLPVEVGGRGLEGRSSPQSPPGPQDFNSSLSPRNKAGLCPRPGDSENDGLEGEDSVSHAVEWSSFIHSLIHSTNLNEQAQTGLIHEEQREPLVAPREEAGCDGRGCFSRKDAAAAKLCEAFLSAPLPSGSAAPQLSPSRPHGYRANSVRAAGTCGRARCGDGEGRRRKGKGRGDRSAWQTGARLLSLLPASGPVETAKALLSVGRRCCMENIHRAYQK
ncbi:hypothetical protein FD754_020340, partial [Muntiacus muntjak]